VIGVVDASALVRLFVPDGSLPEGFEPFMQGVETGANVALAPQLLLAEAGNVVLRKVRGGQLRPEEGDELIALFVRAPIRLAEHGALLASAFRLAAESGLTLYDALYLALAIERGARLFTGDERLAGVAKRTGLG